MKLIVYKLEDNIKKQKFMVSFFLKDTSVIVNWLLAITEKIQGHRMKKNKKRLLIYFRIEEKLAQKLDKRIARAGYTSRSDFFTAVAYVVLYGVESKKQPPAECENEEIAKLPESVTSWVKNTMPSITEEEILAGLHSVIEEMLTPVIAMKGVDVAFDATWEDVRGAFHAKSGVWVTESDLREAYASFASVHRTKLERYRERQLRGDDLGE